MSAAFSRTVWESIGPTGTDAGCIFLKRDMLMQWTEPQFEEILLGCEINSYAVAEL